MRQVVLLLVFLACLVHLAASNKVGENLRRRLAPAAQNALQPAFVQQSQQQHAPPPAQQQQQQQQQQQASAQDVYSDALAAAQVAEAMSLPHKQQQPQQQQQQQQQQHGSLVEAGQQQQKKGFFGKLAKGAGKLLGGAAKLAKGALSGGKGGAGVPPNGADTLCVMCQYWVQQIDVTMDTMSNGMTPAALFALQEEEHVSPHAAAASRSLQSTAEQGPFSPQQQPQQAMLEQSALPLGAIVNGMLGQKAQPGYKRASDVLALRPNAARFDTANPSMPNWSREVARQQYEQLYDAAYQDFENKCVSRSPEPYDTVCKRMIPIFNKVAQGLHYGDRAEKICANTKFCGSMSYLAQTKHGMPKYKAIAAPLI